MAMSGTYPVRLSFEGDAHVDRWRPLVQWLLALPQLIIVWALRSLREALLFVSFFMVLFTKRIPEPLFNMVVMTYRYEWRVVSYALFLREDYPAYDFTATSNDPGTDHTTLSIEYPGEMNRWMPLVKWLLAIPHYIVMVVLAIVSVGIIIAGFFAVLFTGEYPTGLRDLLVAIYRYSVRVEAYVGLLTDEYPPFSLAA